MFTDKQGNQSRECCPPCSVNGSLLILSDWTSFRVFFRVSWEPFEARFDGIHLHFREHVDIVIRTANIVQYERGWSKEISEKLQEEGMISFTPDGFNF